MTLHSCNLGEGLQGQCNSVRVSKGEKHASKMWLLQMSLLCVPAHLGVLIFSLVGREDRTSSPSGLPFLPLQKWPMPIVWLNSIFIPFSYTQLPNIQERLLQTGSPLYPFSTSLFPNASVSSILGNWVIIPIGLLTDIHVHASARHISYPEKACPESLQDLEEQLGVHQLLSGVNHLWSHLYLQERFLPTGQVLVSHSLPLGGLAGARSGSQSFFPHPQPLQNMLLPTAGTCAGGLLTMKPKMQ